MGRTILNGVLPELVAADGNGGLRKEVEQSCWGHNPRGLSNVSWLNCYLICYLTASGNKGSVVILCAGMISQWIEGR
jgi:hypothetical protein